MSWIFRLDAFSILLGLLIIGMALGVVGLWLVMRREARPEMEIDSELRHS